MKKSGKREGRRDVNMRSFHFPNTAVRDPGLESRCIRENVAGEGLDNRLRAPCRSRCRSTSSLHFAAQDACRQKERAQDAASVH